MTRITEWRARTLLNSHQATVLTGFAALLTLNHGAADGPDPC